MSEQKLAAELRTEFGKGFARRARAAGQIPPSSTVTALSPSTSTCRAAPPPWPSAFPTPCWPWTSTAKSTLPS
ncbi:50S ribosomal protein L25/general stress protein Ctc [Arthrobacter sp. Hiyo8]|nr:50S ribosomal protein L25/general stress protein Ctc [Arthrobacter sp. Hiyo8]